MLFGGVLGGFIAEFLTGRKGLQRDVVGSTRRYLLDQKLLALFLDGQRITGILRSFDKFASVVVEGACEQVIVGDLYCDIPLGLHVIRGNNIVLVGELAQQVERDAMDLKGSVRKRTEFLLSGLIASSTFLVHVHYRFGALMEHVMCFFYCGCIRVAMIKSIGRFPGIPFFGPQHI